MEDEIKNFVEDILEINKHHRYDFKTLYGFTFVFKITEVFIKKRVASCEITPLAIIYEENSEFYLAPLDVVDDIEGIIKEFVKII